MSLRPEDAPGDVAPPWELTLDDYRAVARLRHVLRRFLAFSETGAAAHGVTSPQHQALLAIKAHGGEGGMNVGELADTLVVRAHSAGELVGRLVQRGLVVRKASPRDRRHVLLRLTREGERVLEAITRRNLTALRGSLPAYADLLRALGELDLAHPPGP